MNYLTKVLLEDLLEDGKKKITAIYGGGFKPPTKGHFEVVAKAAEQNPEIDDIIIYVGSGERNGISQGESIQIWELYKKYLPMKVSIEPVKAPVGDILRYAKDHPEEEVLWIVGARENNPEDFADLASRTRTLDKYPNLQLRLIQTTGGISGTAARKAVKDNNKEQFFNMIPDIPEKQQVWDIVSPVVKEGIIDNTKNKLKKFIIAVKQEGQETREAVGLIIKSAKGEINLTDEQKKQIGEQLKDILKLVGLTALAALPGGSIVAILLKLFKQTHLITPSSMMNEVVTDTEVIYSLDLKEIVTVTESFYLNIPKFNQPKTVQQYLIESINEISLSKENAAKINGDLTGGTFTVGDITYEYSIKNIPNPYKNDLGLFYNIQFTPSGEVTSIPKGGKENYIKILSTMYKIILDFIEKEQPTYVGISSLDNSGDKNYHTLYNRLTSNHMDIIPGYFRKDSNLTFDSPQGKGRFIVLKKKDSLNEKKSKNPFGLKSYVRELVTDTEVICDNCGWEWSIADGGDDLYICHKCGHDNNPDLEEGRKKKSDPKKGTGKKPEGSGRRLYTDEDPKDTVRIKFKTKEDIVDTLNKTSFKAKSHARQSQVINLIHQRVRAAYGKSKDPEVKSRLKRALDYIEKRKEMSKKKTERLRKMKEASDPQAGTALPYGSGFAPVKENDPFGLNELARQFVNESLKETWRPEESFVSLSKYMIDNGMNIKPLPKIKVISDDEDNASNLLGKTAYYNPTDKSITLYTMDRHPKDILRSFAHEMVHHEQNLDGRLNNINTTNTNEDGILPEIEKEAYEKGNMMLRNWEDSIKNV